MNDISLSLDEFNERILMPAIEQQAKAIVAEIDEWASAQPPLSWTDRMLAPLRRMLGRARDAWLVFIGKAEIAEPWL